MRILYCSDHRRDGRLLKAMRELRHITEIADDMDDGLAQANAGGWRVIMLDLASAHPAAVGAFRAAAADSLLVVITASDHSSDRIALLRAGADNVFSHPYEVREIGAQLNAFARRALRGGVAEADLPFDLEQSGSAAILDGTRIELSGHEYAIMALLAERPGEVVDRHDILEAVWGAEPDLRPKVVDNCIARLRTKLERGRPWRLLHAVRGHGYMFRIDPA